MQCIVQVECENWHSEGFPRRAPDAETGNWLALYDVTDTSFQKPEEDRAGPVVPKTVGAIRATQDTFRGSLGPITGAPTAPE
eukprot:6908582-Pyramimonas_sp.AAC.1